MPDREKVIKGLSELEGFLFKRYGEVSSDETHIWYDRFLAVSDALALLKEQEVVSAHWDDDTGHWIEGDRNGIDPHTRTTGEMIDTFRCSWCGFYQYWKTPFCPNCGAKMEGR